MSETNKALVRRWFDDLFSGGDPRAVEEIIHPEYVLHDPGFPDGVRGVEGFRRFLMRLRTAFPDLRSTLEDIMAADADRVVTRDVWGGTNSGSFLGFPPTNRRVAAIGIDVFRVADGRIIEQWASPDLLGAALRLGLLTLPGREH